MFLKLYFFTKNIKKESNSYEWEVGERVLGLNLSYAPANVSAGRK